MQSESHGSDVFFLGIAERAAYVRDGQTNVYKWNVLGLRHVVLTHILPVSLGGVSFGIALSAEAVLAGREVQLRIIHESGVEAGRINLRLAEPQGRSQDPTIDFQGVFLPVTHPTVLFSKLPVSPPIVAMLPGLYQIGYIKQHGEEIVGQFRIAVVDPLPLSAERVAAIRTDPTASKAVRMELGCRFCDSKSRSYASLERNADLASAGWTWYADLPDSFECACGKTSIPLAYLRKNLHGLLGANIAARDGEAEFTPLYERGTLESVRSTFSRILEQAPKEERLQQFLQDNPILLHQFAPLRLFIKPPILTRFVADFAVLTPKKELVLIELERADTRLMNKNGGVAAPLSHAFDQVRDWLHVADEHRLALLDALKISIDEVSAIRGVVVAGRDAGYDALHLRRLKGEDRGKVSVYTYDDLLFALGALCKTIDNF